MNDEQRNTIYTLVLLQPGLRKRNVLPEDKEYIMTMIDSAVEDITDEGIILDFGSPSHRTTIAMYASWLYRKQTAENKESPMPRMLRYRLNNLIFKRVRNNA